MQASSYNAGVTAPATLTPEALQNRATALGLDFPDDLPVSARWQEIAQALLAHQVLILCGETGSGKTTQLPKIALACGFGAKGKSIGHTQPRRLAAVSVARRIAQEIQSDCGRMPGARVGYKIRFNDQARPGVPIKLLTDGMLLAETQTDPRLEAYDLIIIDEAHERSLNIDFLLGYLHNLLSQRPRLKLIITSATLDAEKFSRHFFNAPILEVSGRLYPVAIRYQPPEKDDDDLIDRVVTGITAALAEPVGMGPADVLVFLPGEREIRATADALADRLRPVSGHGRRQSVEALPLFSRLTQADQDRIFRPAEGRRVVLSTNLAETSITVPGIRYVVDAGLARVKRYRYKGKVEQLQIEPVSQAQAQQRAGRAGRLSEGICIRLYSEEDFHSRPVHADPEIHRSSLASVILQMKALRLPAIEVFPFVDPPSKKAIADGMALLNELGAIDSAGGLTEIGRDIAALPLDPKLARMLVAARQSGCLKEMAVLVAALSVQDPRDRPLAEQQAADAAHKKFADEKSEFLSWLRLWDWIEAAFAEKLSRRKLDQALRVQFLSPLRVREWRELHQQVVSWITEKNWRFNERPTDYASLHQAILTGLLSNIGCRIDSPVKQASTGGPKGGTAASAPAGTGLWQGTHEVKFAVWPGSHLAKKPPRWLMAAEQVETSRLFARTVAGIEPEWVEQAAARLIKVSYSEPHWEKKAGKAIGYARGVLYGLPIFQRRRVAWSSLGPEEAREARALLIREGLVAGEIDTRLKFHDHNQRLIHEVEKLEQKARRLDLLVDESLIEAFYDQHIPQNVVDLDSLTAWLRKAGAQDPQLLCLRKEDLMRHEAAGITTDQFPRQYQQADLQCALDYHFDPGAADDGLIITVRDSDLGRLDAQRLDWLVPGMRKDKVMAIVKSLPQRHRRHLLPLADYVEGFCARWQSQAGNKPLVKALIEDIAQEKGLALTADEFKRDALPAHLSAFIRVIDQHGRQLAQGRDLTALRSQLGVADPQVEETAAWQRLADRFAERIKEPIKAMARDLVKDASLTLAWAAWGGRSHGSAEQLCEQVRQLALRRAFLGEPWPETDKDFEQRLTEGRSRFLLLAQETQRWLKAVFAEHQVIARKLAAARPAQPIHKDIEEQIARLLPPDFVVQTPDARARHLPRYLKAMALRLDKHRADPARDLARWQELQRVEQPFWRWAKANPGPWSEAMTEFRWLLEECRVVQFAQELKTPMPVSVKRLEKTWETISRQ